MLARNHLPFAAATYLLVAPAVGISWPIALATLPFAMFGGLLPDVDHPNSLLGQKLPGVSHLIRRVLGHRGGTHSLLAVLALSLGLARATTYLHVTDSFLLTLLLAASSAILIGYLSHLAADALTKTGVPLLWPLRRPFRSPLPFTTGSWVEYVVTFLFVGAVGYHFAHLLALL